MAPIRLRPRSIAARIVRTAAVEAGIDRLADQEMADIEFGNLRQSGDPFGGDEIEPVAGMDFEARILRHHGAADDALEFGRRGRAIARRQRVAPGAGMDLDHRRTDGDGGLDLLGRGGDEQRNPNAGGGQFADGGTQGLALACSIEAALGGALLPPLGNDAGGVRLELARDADHFRRRRHFEIERLVDALLEPNHIVIDDVAAILAQMRGDAVGAGGDRNLGGLHRIGMPAAARIAHGRDMIDIDAEADGLSRHAYPFTRSALATTFFARNCEMIEVRCLRL